MKKLIITLCLSLSLFYSAFPQQQSKPVPEQRDDVIRVDTSLVQTSVAVFDKQGVFVDGLRPEDFQLKIDGKPQSIQFFSRIAAGTEQERYQVAAARSGQPATSTAISANAPDPPLITPACPYTSSPCLKSEGETPSPTCFMTPAKSIPKVDGN